MYGSQLSARYKDVDLIVFYWAPHEYTVWGGIQYLKPQMEHFIFIFLFIGNTNAFHLKLLNIFNTELFLEEIAGTHGSQC